MRNHIIHSLFEPQTGQSGVENSRTPLGVFCVFFVFVLWQSRLLLCLISPPPHPCSLLVAVAALACLQVSSIKRRYMRNHIIHSLFEPQTGQSGVENSRTPLGVFCVFFVFVLWQSRLLLCLIRSWHWSWYSRAYLNIFNGLLSRMLQCRLPSKY